MGHIECTFKPECDAMSIPYKEQFCGCYNEEQRIKNECKDCLSMFKQTGQCYCDNVDPDQLNNSNPKNLTKSKMNVKLISITKACAPDLEQLSPEELIIYIARVSNPGNQMNNETAPNLIRYLIRKKHWSPFDMVDMTFEIVTSRAIAAQILRHRSFCFQEFSQRYAEVSQFEPIELRRQAEKNRQSSDEVFDPVLYGPVDSDDKIFKASYYIDLLMEKAEILYKDLLRVGVAKEVARMVLPLTTQTKIYMKGSIRSWIHYLDIRLDEHTQKEHRNVAMQAEGYFANHFPNIYEAISKTR